MSSRSRIPINILPLGLLLVAGVTDGCHSTLECRSNTDCPASVCTNGRCRPPDAGTEGDVGRSTAPDVPGDDGAEAGPDHPAPQDILASALDSGIVDAPPDEAAVDGTGDLNPATPDVRDAAENLADTPLDPPAVLELLSATSSIGGTPIRLVKRDRYVVLGDWDIRNAENGEGSIQIYDVADPAHPSYVSALTTTNQEVQDLALDGDRLYVANDAWGLRVVDLSDPKNPTTISTRRDGSYGHSVVVGPRSANGGSTVLLGYTYSGGLSAYAMADGDIPQPFTYQPSLVTPEATVTNVEQIVVSGDSAYVLVSDGWTRACLEILRASKPTLLYPRKLCLPFDQNGLPGDIRVQGQFLYYAAAFHPGNSASPTNPGGLRIINLVDPADPKMVGSLDLRPRAGGILWRGTGLAVDGPRVFLVGNTAVHVIDVSTPTAPRLLGSYPFPSSFGECQGGTALVEGNLVYVGAHCKPTGGRGGLLIYRRSP